MGKDIPEGLDVAVSEFITETSEIIDRVTLMLSKADLNQLTHEQIDALYRDMHTMKGSAQLFGFQSIGLISHVLEASLEPVRQGKVLLIQSFVDLIFESLDVIGSILKEPNLDLQRDKDLGSKLKSLVPRIIAAATDHFDNKVELRNEPVPSDIITKEQKNIPEKMSSEMLKSISCEGKETQEKEIVAPKVDSIVEQKIKPDSGDTVLEAGTIRVQVGLLDKLMNLVGEMVLVRNQILQYSRDEDNNDYLHLTQRLDLVTSELQDQVMKTRMQPIGSVFNKFQRLVRDISRDLGKKVDLRIIGAETELDKSLIEAIKDPLTHIIRNSCDHGLELPADRISQGKEETGVLMLRAFQEGGQVVIEIQDDGKGINPEKILSKAIEKKVVSAEVGAKMSPREIQELIFAPGFSTAEKVSSVSGRGVGMDVVKTNVEKVGGVVELKSVPGKGTTIQLRIPLTLAIVPAMIIRVEKDFFTIPQVKVQELLRIDMDSKDQLGKVEELQGQLVYRLRGRLLPLVGLKEVLHDVSVPAKRPIYNVIVINNDDNPYGLLVDEVCDTADIVVKPLSSTLKKISIFSGATILGDGQVALILDAQGLASHVHITSGHENTKSELKASAADQVAKLTEVSEYIVFRLNTEGSFCIPLSLVQRLEEFDAAQIEYSGSDRLVQYRGGLLPIVSLDEYFGYHSEGHVAKLPVVVVTKRSKMFGFQVQQINDLVSIDSDISPHLKETNGVLGTFIGADNHVTTVLDIFGIVNELLGEQNVDVSKGGTIAEKIPQTPLRILFAEDTPFFVKQVKKVLEKIGAVVVHAPDGEAAFQLLENTRKGEDRFDCVLSDIEMPRLNGFDLATKIRESKEWKELPLIALTTRFKESDRTRGHQVGFNHYLEKLKSDELINVLAGIQSGKRAS